MGDAVLCTPALRAIRQHYSSAEISFFANSIVRQVLSEGNFNDLWLEQTCDNPFTIARMLKEHNFTHAVLFKNSIGSALAVFLAGIPARIGYVRQGRGLLLTDKLFAPKISFNKFKPISMIDYYLAIASWLGADSSDRSLELSINPQDSQSLQAKLPEIAESTGPIVIFVPGGAFGLSKCWPTERFSQTADWLISNYDARVCVSVAPEPAEKQIAAEICQMSRETIINLADKNINLGELKSLFSAADLTICNDTGPRHIAIALKRNVITLFGPNDPAWTETGWEKEIQIVGEAACSPCAKPVCKKEQLLCMEAITVEQVCEAAKELLGNH